MRVILLILFSLAMVACQTNQNTDYTRALENWRGKPSKSLLAAWGQPDEARTLANSHSFFIYKTMNYKHQPSEPVPAIGVNVSSTGRPVMTSMSRDNMAWTTSSPITTCVYTFEIDKKGIIINATASGNHCGAGAILQ